MTTPQVVHPGRQTIPSAGLPVVRRVDELNAHPSCARHHITASTSSLASAVALGDLAFEIPLIITRTGFIVFGHERHEIARLHGRVTIACLEFDLDEAASLRWLIELNRDAKGLNDFKRILLALDLEPKLRELAVANQRTGGHLKGSLKLATASALDVRVEIAKVAGVCSANVGKVKYLLAHAIPEIKQGVREGELSIHRAWHWSKEVSTAQREALRRHRLNKGILKSAAQYASRRKRQKVRSCEPVESFTTHYSETLLNHLAKAIRLGTIAITAVNHAGHEIFVPQHLVEAFRVQQEGGKDEG